MIRAYGSQRRHLKKCRLSLSLFENMPKNAWKNHILNVKKHKAGYVKTDELIAKVGRSQNSGFRINPDFSSNFILNSGF